MSDAADAERLDQFMGRANAAYYGRQDPFADFTTAPEISQIFGEIIGAWMAVGWEALGSPAPVLLAEAGPGRGTLMADARRLTARVAPAFHAACRLHLIETSPRLRAEQAARIPDASWHEDLASLPEGPLLLIANEFLDALPIRQFRYDAGQWAERHVRDGRFLEIPCPPPPGLDPAEAAAGGLLEWNAPGEAFVEALARRIAGPAGGLALLIDYGLESNPRDSLQAIRARHFADPLQAAGEADLTALVDFGAMARAARRGGAETLGPVGQGAFLTALGLMARAERLGQGRPPEAAAAILAGARRLAEPMAMGRLFKVLAITPPGFPPLPGFAP